MSATVDEMRPVTLAIRYGLLQRLSMACESTIEDWLQDLGKQHPEDEMRMHRGIAELYESMLLLDAAVEKCDKENTNA